VQPPSCLFPEGFLWGSATSAWQIEGGSVSNEYGEMHREGRIAGGGDPAEAAGFWRFYERDVALMKRMHHRSFRMSVEWARVEPEEGCFDEEAIRHYRRIIQSIRSAGILPVVDLLHHSSPLWLYRQGGWTSRGAVRYLQRFAVRVVEGLGDLVGVWLTINEPTIWAATAYLGGVLPPYGKSFRLFLRALDVFAQGHVALYETVNEVHAARGWARPTVGFAHAAHGVDPSRPRNLLDELSAALVRRIMEDGFYRKILRRAKTIDIVGVNYYLCFLARFPLAIRVRTDLPATKEGWPIDPQGFYGVLCSLWRAHHLPIWVMENGVGEDDDELRPRFLLDHLFHMHRAIREGVDVRAYHHWATMDTLEYQKGYGIRYGLVKVGLENDDKPRHLRRSGEMYGEIARANGITAEIVAKYVPSWTPESFPLGYSRRYQSAPKGELL